MLLFKPRFSVVGEWQLEYAVRTLADGSTISTLINSWASIAGESDEAVFPEYVAASVFLLDDAFPFVPQKDLYRAKCVMKSFVFNSSKISALN